MAQVLHAAARRKPNNIYYRGDGDSVTYAQASRCARSAAGALRAQTSASADLPLGVSFASPAKLIRVIWACIESDVSLAFMPHCDDTEQMRMLLSDVGARVLLTDNEALANAPYSRVWDPGAGVGEGGAADDEHRNLAGGTSGAFLLLTSGTTGDSRWVRCNYSQCRRAIEAMAEAGALEHAADQTVFLTGALYHSYGLSTMLEYTFTGSTLLFHSGRSPFGPAGELLQPDIKESVTAIEGVPYYYDQLASLASRIRLPGLAHIGYGGGAINPATIERLRAAWPATSVSVRYGLTETPSVVAHRVFDPQWRSSWRSSGRVLPCYSVRVCDEAGRKVGAGRIGEIVVGGDCLGEYLGAEPARQLATGDLGYLDRHGSLSIVGRKSSFLKYRGYRLSPERIEAIAGGFDGVADCRALTRGAELVAEVVLRDPRTDLGELREHLRRRLPSYAVPDVIERVSAIPRTASGKVRRG